MKRVMLESPYAGNVEANIKYAKFCVGHCLKNGEAPFVSHLLYTQEGILDDTKPEERKLGMDAGHAWLEGSEYMVVYADLGLSPGMLERMSIATQKGMKIEIRVLFPENHAIVNKYNTPLFFRILTQEEKAESLKPRLEVIADKMNRRETISLEEYLLLQDVYSTGKELIDIKNEAG